MVEGLGEGEVGGADVGAAHLADGAELLLVVVLEQLLGGLSLLCLGLLVALEAALGGDGGGGGGG